MECRLLVCCRRWTRRGPGSHHFCWLGHSRRRRGRGSDLLDDCSLDRAENGRAGFRPTSLADRHAGSERAGHDFFRGPTGVALEMNATELIRKPESQERKSNKKKSVITNRRKDFVLLS